MITIVLRIDEQVGNGYPVRLFCDEGGAAGWDDAELAIGRIPADLGGFVAAGATATGARDAEDVVQPDGVAAEPDPAEAGNTLYNLLIAENDASAPLPAKSIRAVWNNLAQRFTGQDGESGRRVVLDVRPEELRGLPWELLHSSTEPLWIAREGDNSLVRGPVDFTVPRGPADGPLRVMIVVGCSKSEVVPLKVKDEVEAVEKTLWSLRHEVEFEGALWHPNREKIRSEYERFRPHIFHFIGHGRHVKGDGPKARVGKSSLVLDGVDWLPDEITSDLTVVPSHAPAVVFLNACHTGNEGPGLPQAWSLAKTFFHLGARAVIGMITAVRGEDAAKFANDFYKALAKALAQRVALSEPVELDRVVAEVRRIAATRSIKDGLKIASWAIPTLHFRVRPDRVLPPTRPIPRTAYDQVRGQFRQNDSFVDRTQERGKLLALAAPSAARGGGLVVVQGARYSGKTAILSYLRESLLLRNSPVLHVDFRTPGSIEFPGVLMALRRARVQRLVASPAPGGTATQPEIRLVHFPLPPGPFAEFDARMDGLLDGMTVLMAVSNQALKLKFRPIFGENLPEYLFQNLLEGLTGAATTLQAGATDAPALVVMLDHLTALSEGSIESGHFGQKVVPSLFNPIAIGDAPGVQVFAAMATAEVDIYLPTGGPSFTPIPVPNRMKVDDYQGLVYEFSRRKVFFDPKWRERADRWQAVADSFKIALTGPGYWELNSLSIIEQFVLKPI